MTAGKTPEKTVSIVSIDPGGRYLRGLGAELEAARGVLETWTVFCGQLQRALGEAALGEGPLAAQNESRYRDALKRAAAREKQARAAVEAAVEAVRDQQERNTRDWEERAAGLGRKP